MSDGARAEEVYELAVTLLDVEPPIWRRVTLPAGVTLADLHEVIQRAMGWYDLHLHQFVTSDGVRYEANDPDIDPDVHPPRCATRERRPSGTYSPVLVTRSAMTTTSGMAGSIALSSS